MTRTSARSDIYDREILKVVQSPGPSGCCPPSSAIHSLPHELLLYIFSLLVRQDDDRTVSAVPIHLSHVCRRWRLVALSCGTLWTAITLTFPVTTGKFYRTASWLERSGVLPLTLHLDFRDPSWDFEEGSHSFRWEHMDIIVRLLLPHVTRWESVELLTDTWAPIFAFLYYTSHVKSAPMLQRISLSRCNEYFASKSSTFEPAVLGRPVPMFGGKLENLREVTLFGVHVDWSSSGLRHLRKLEFKYHSRDVMPSLMQFREILAASPEMEELSIVGWGVGWGGRSIHETPIDELRHDSVPHHKAPLHGGIRLSRLRKFSFGFLDVHYAINLLSLFSSMALTDFSCEDVAAALNPYDALDATPLLDYIVASRHLLCAGETDSGLCHLSGSKTVPSIRRLTLRGIRATPASFSRLFGQCGALEHLSLVDVGDGALRALAQPAPPDPVGDSCAGGSELLPCLVLKTLVCEDVDPQAFAKMVALRAVQGAPLREIALDTSRICEVVPEEHPF